MRIRTGVRVEYFSTAWMSIEVIGAIWFGVVAGSFALLAFGGDSFVELLSGLAVLRFLRNPSSSEADTKKTTERVTNTLLFSLVPVIGFGMFYSYFTGLRPESSPLGIIVAAGAVVIMPYLWFEKRKIGRETRSLPLSMDSIASLTCIFMSVALLVGLVVEYLLGFWWVDYLATGAILAFVAREAVESYHELRHNH